MITLLSRTNQELILTKPAFFTRNLLQVAYSPLIYEKSRLDRTIFV